MAARSLAINIEKQHTAEEPCVSPYRHADEQLVDERVVSNSIMLGFPMPMFGNGEQRHRITDEPALPGARR
jgi:hypothetical protein